MTFFFLIFRTKLGYVQKISFRWSREVVVTLRSDIDVQTGGRLAWYWISDKTTGRPRQSQTTQIGSKMGEKAPNYISKIISNTLKWHDRELKNSFCTFLQLNEIKKGFDW